MENYLILWSWYINLPNCQSMKSNICLHLLLYNHLLTTIIILGIVPKNTKLLFVIKISHNKCLLWPTCHNITSKECHKKVLAALFTYLHYCSIGPKEMYIYHLLYCLPFHFSLSSLRQRILRSTILICMSHHCPSKDFLFIYLFYNIPLSPLQFSCISFC